MASYLGQSHCTEAHGCGLCFENKILHEAQYYFTCILTEKKNAKMFSFGPCSESVAQRDEEIRNPVS